MENSEKSKNLIIHKKERLELIISFIFFCIIPFIYVYLSDGFTDNLNEIYFYLFCFYLFFIPFFFVLGANLFSGIKIFQNPKIKLAFQIFLGIICIVYFSFCSFLTSFFFLEGNLLCHIIGNLYFCIILVIPFYVIGKLPVLQKGNEKKLWNILMILICSFFIYAIIYFTVAHINYEKEQLEDMKRQELINQQEHIW